MTLLNRTDCEGFHRRDFLQIGAAGALGLTLPGFLAAQAQARNKGGSRPAKARGVILLWLAGTALVIAGRLPPEDRTPLIISAAPQK